MVRHGRAPHLAPRLAGASTSEAAVRDVAQRGARASGDCGTGGLHDVVVRIRSLEQLRIPASRNSLKPFQKPVQSSKRWLSMSEATLPCFAPLGVLAPVWHEEVLFVTGLQNVIERRPWTTPDCP